MPTDPDPDLTGIVICRKASEYLKPGAVLGYECKVCGEPLQVSPSGIPLLKKGILMPLCNPCGFAMQKRMQDANAPHAVLIGPEAARQLEEFAAKVKR